MAVVLDHAEDGNADLHLGAHTLGNERMRHAAVDEHHVRQGSKLFVPVQIALDAAREHLLHRGVVVGMGREALDLKAAVGAPFGLRPLVDDHGGDNVARAGVGNIVGLHALRRRGKRQHARKLRKRAVFPLLRGRHALHVLARVALRHGKKLRLLAALRHMERHLASRALGQNLRKLVRALDLAGQQDFTRQDALIEVILRQQRREDHLLALVLRCGEEVQVAPRHAAVLNVQHGAAAFKRPAVNAPDVGVGADAGDDLLAFAQHLDGADAVAQRRCLLKVQCLGLAFHLLAQRAREAAVMAAQQLFRLTDAAQIFLLVRRAAAKPVAASHVMVEAGTLLADVARKGAAARRQPEGRADRVDRRACFAPPAERPKVERVVVRGFRDHCKARIMPRAEAHKGIALVIFQEDVVARHVLLDERVFQDQRLKLA